MSGPGGSLAALDRAAHGAGIGFGSRTLHKEENVCDRAAVRRAQWNKGGTTHPGAGRAERGLSVRHARLRPAPGPIVPWLSRSIIALSARERLG